MSVGEEVVIGHSPFIEEPATIPWRVVLVAVEKSDGTYNFHTHREDVEGNRYWGHYYQSDYLKAVADYNNLCVVIFRQLLFLKEHGAKIIVK